MSLTATVCDWCNKPGRAGRLLVAVLVVSFVGKVALRLAVLGDANYWETGYSFYFNMADNYLRHGYICQGDAGSAEGAYYAYRPPLYPLLIAAVCRLTNYSAAAFVVC